MSVAGVSAARYRRMLAAESEANARALASLETVPEASRAEAGFDRAMRLLPHCTLAREAWLARITGEAWEMPADWFPRWEVGATRERLAAADRAWDRWVTGLTEAELSREVTYQSSDGRRFVSLVDDIATHAFNHSTYHRGQLARIVHELGGTRAVTDYIGLTRRTLEPGAGA